MGIYSICWSDDRKGSKVFGQVLVDVGEGDKEESEDEDKGDEKGKQANGEQKGEYLPFMDDLVIKWCKFYIEYRLCLWWFSTQEC